MPREHSAMSYFVRRAVVGVRNTGRYHWAGRPAVMPRLIQAMARSGLHDNVGDELERGTPAWRQWVLAKKGRKLPEIRVGTSTTVTNRPGAVPTFVGIGLDENVSTRLLKDHGHWRGIGAADADSIFGVRSRTCDLVWSTGNPIEPVSGHTPAIKRQVINGTRAAITEQHGGRDRARENAVMTTRGDATSPEPFHDTAIMASLATIKHMSSPSTELMHAKAATLALPNPRYAALTGNVDLRVAANFDTLVAHVQEERERKKWETGAAMMADPRLSPLVPSITRSYLTSLGNDPRVAMERFRSDTHGLFGLLAPPINSAPSSDTEDLSARSLHAMAQDARVGGRPRALSNPRALAPVVPPNSRGY